MTATMTNTPAIYFKTFETSFPKLLSKTEYTEILNKKKIKHLGEFPTIFELSWKKIDKASKININKNRIKSSLKKNIFRNFEKNIKKNAGINSCETDAPIEIPMKLLRVNDIDAIII
ncbi:hypothetical protein [Alteromonas gracilis]|uniref:hypothetical protein n=1 Tax=Alteromonas gracilis TaxID=1479524 RepID=UPI002FE08454